MLLADGRRITANETSNGETEKIIKMHPDFRMIILANRPGYPFLGNDFYKGLEVFLALLPSTTPILYRKWICCASMAPMCLRNCFAN